MNERILMKLAEDEKRRKLTESQKRVLTSAALSGLSAPLAFTWGTVRRRGKVHPGNLALVSGLGTLTGAGSQALAEKIRERKFQKEAAYGDTIKNLARRVERRAQNKYLDELWKYYSTGGWESKPFFAEANKPVARQMFRARDANRFVQRNAKALTTGAIGLGAAGAAAGTVAAVRAIKNKRQGQEKTASYHAARELLGLQKEAAYGDTIKNLAGRVEGGARNAFQKLRNTPHGNTIKNLAGRVEGGARNAFQKLRNTPQAIKPLQQLQQRNLARSASQFAQRNAKALTAGGIGLGAAGAIAGGIAAVRAIKNKRQGQEKTASYYVARELLGLQKEADLTLAGPQSIKKTPAKDQILKMIRDLAKKK